MEFSRRGALAGGAGIAFLAGCNSEIPKAALKSAGHGETFPPDVLPSFSETATGMKSVNEFNPQNVYYDEIGNGFDTVFDDMKSMLVRGELVRTDNTAVLDADTSDKVNYEMTESQESYYAFTKKSARAKARYKLFSGGASGRKSSEKTSNSYSIHICALARRFDQMAILKNDSLRIDPEAERTLREYRKSPGQLLRAFGDSYVAGVVPGAELFMDIRFETSSKSARGNASAALRAEYGKVASGQANYGQLIRSASAAKKVTINLSGTDGLDLPKQFTADEAYNLIQQFMRNADVATKSTYLVFRPVDTLSRDGKRLNFVDHKARQRRDRYVSEAEAILEYLDRTEADAAYVTSNTGEFDRETVERAVVDLRQINAARKDVLDIGAEAYGSFLNTGVQDFDYRVFDTKVPAFKSYEQLEPSKPAPPPVERPRPEPRSRCNGHCTGGIR